MDSGRWSGYRPLEIATVRGRGEPPARGRRSRYPGHRGPRDERAHAPDPQGPLHQRITSASSPRGDQPHPGQARGVGRSCRRTTTDPL